MRKWLLFILLGVALSACEQEIDPFEGGSSIYFDDNSAGLYEVSWATLPTEVRKMNIRLKVNLFGAVKDYPRKFSVQVYSPETDTMHSKPGVDYTEFPLEYEIPAMENHTYITIELLRTDTLTKQGRRFGVYLQSNDEFGFEYMKYDEMDDGTLVPINNHCTIYMDEVFPRPWWWNRIGVPIFGDWSTKKGILICDIGKLDRAKFQGEIDGGDDNITSALLRFVGRKVHLWLLDNPMLDEDDEPMEMGVDSMN